MIWLNPAAWDALVSCEVTKGWTETHHRPLNAVFNWTTLHPMVQRWPQPKQIPTDTPKEDMRTAMLNNLGKLDRNWNAMKVAKDPKGMMKKWITTSEDILTEAQKITHGLSLGKAYKGRGKPNKPVQCEQYPTRISLAS